MSCRLSVVIPTYRRCASVRRALLALTRQTLPAERYEVVVAIDGSEDGTQEFVAQFQAAYRLRAVWQLNRGRAAACNAGVRAAAGDIVVLLDDDMEPAPECLEAHLRAHTAIPDAGIVGAAPIRANRSSPPVAQYIAGKFNDHLERLSRPHHQFALRDFYSGNFSILRRRLLDIGGFDEAFMIYGNEDLELSVRLKRAGVQIVYRADALAHQHYDKSFAELAHDNFAKGRTAVLLASKHPDALSYLRLDAARGSIKRRLLQSGMLGVGAIWSGAPDFVIRLVGHLERHRPQHLNKVYALTLDYFYWRGVRAALQTNRRSGRELSALPRPT